MSTVSVAGNRLGMWHDLLERLWRDVDPATLSADFQDYCAARADFEAYLVTVPAGARVPMYLDSPTTSLLDKIERTKARIMDRSPISSADIAEKALVIRDEVFVHRSLEMGPIVGDDLARLLTCVIEAAFPRPSN